MYNSIEIAERIKKTAKTQGVSTKEMLIKCELSKNTISSMLAGSTPKSENLAKIADYLKVSVDYLLGRTDDPVLHQLEDDSIKYEAARKKTSTNETDDDTVIEP